LTTVSDGNAAPASPKSIEMQLIVEAGEPLTGTVRVHGRSGEEPFHGWLGLIAIINAARASADRDRHERPA
jgi:hypothetical protein